MVHLSARLFLLGCAALGVLSRTTIQSQTCTKEACFFSWINRDVYPSSGGRCGEVDAAPRMPAGIFNNPVAVAKYIDFTIKYYSIDNAYLEQKSCDRKGRLQHSNQSVSWTDPTLMKVTCGVLCKCAYPNCPDVPDDPRKDRYCSLCGPKFNAPVQVQFWVPKNSFVSAPLLLQARTRHAASPLGFGRVLIAGGQDYGFHTLATTEIYSSLSDSFTPGPPLASKRFHHSASPLPFGRVLIAGGQDGKEGQHGNFIPLNTTEIYSPETNSFAPGPPLASTRYSHAASPLPDGRVLIVGGRSTTDEDIVLDSSEIYDPKTNSFAPGPRLATARSTPAASPLPDGRVLVAGGDGGRTLFLTTEIYNPKTNSFAPGPPLARERTRAAASPLPDGRVLIAGGYTLYNGLGYDGLATSEIYNPQTNSFAPGPGLTRKLFNFAASPLPILGGVLITGGLSYGIPPKNEYALNILNTTEIYLFNNN